MGMLGVEWVLGVEGRRVRWVKKRHTGKGL